MIDQMQPSLSLLLVILLFSCDCRVDDCAEELDSPDVELVCTLASPCLGRLE